MHQAIRPLSTLPVFTLLLTLLCMSLPSYGESALTALQVYKNPQCGCCGKWVDHIQAAGFDTKVTDRDDLSQLKSELGVGNQYQSCHTATDGKYVFEGHIPASAMKRFLAAPPEGAIGLAVPGMPVGSPGMEMGDRHQDYNVLLLMEDGTASVFEEIRQ
ncbi:DUF411 domain-containing protein [Spongiibacter taiwanensis]|uniref:DUF411 domain-containing protein n=1 Tax=Spongiibacter taiwanensis TaxID=1748242 RepID=UPI002035C7BD|nr:DUF411 domain-containing protein [Spongiibacter taiwanensis]USA42881.1 DUF411 domain-containing protein [Spongiibacter taiwanensis]